MSFRPRFYKKLVVASPVTTCFFFEAKDWIFWGEFFKIVLSGILMSKNTTESKKMALHNWTKASKSNFHSFLHHGWIWQMMKYLNKVVLPAGYMAVAERSFGPYIVDVAFKEDGEEEKIFPPPSEISPTLVIEAPVFTLIGKQISIYDQKNSQIVAVIELVSPGNKDAHEKVDLFVEKSVNYLAAGVHYSLIDILSPTKFVDNFAKKILFAIKGGEILTEKSLYAAAFQCITPAIQLYYREFEVGENLPEIPIFLTSDYFVLLDLKETYSDTMEDLPESVIPAANH